MYKDTLAYAIGKTAYWEYKSQDECPYDGESVESHQWFQGYIDARAIDNGDDEE